MLQLNVILVSVYDCLNPWNFKINYLKLDFYSQKYSQSLLKGLNTSGIQMGASIGTCKVDNQSINDVKMLIIDIQLYGSI